MPGQDDGNSLPDSRLAPVIPATLFAIVFLLVL